jgi:hypothetical protein
MRKSNTLMVLGRVISNPKKFAGEWRQAQHELTNLQQRHSQDMARSRRSIGFYCRGYTQRRR